VSQRKLVTETEKPGTVTYTSSSSTTFLGRPMGSARRRRLSKLSTLLVNRPKPVRAPPNMVVVYHDPAGGAIKRGEWDVVRGFWSEAAALVGASTAGRVSDPPPLPAVLRRCQRRRIQLPIVATLSSHPVLGVIVEGGVQLPVPAFGSLCFIAARQFCCVA
jgi:hypothetical protein